MVDTGGEGDLGRLEWVVGWEMNIQEVNSTSIWRVIWSHDGSLPMELIFLIEWSSRAVGGRVLSEVDEFFLDPSKSHSIVFLINN